MARKISEMQPINLEGEQWRDVPGYEGTYMASNLGRIKSLSRSVVSTKCGHLAIKQDKIVGAIRKTSGYYVFCVKSFTSKSGVKNIYSHRAVAMAWISNPDNKPQINHKDGIKSNNNINNLEWCTAHENAKHKFDTGLQSNKGENQSQRKLSNEQVLEIRARRDKGESYRKIAKDYPVSVRNVRAIVGKLKWSHI